MGNETVTPRLLEQKYVCLKMKCDEQQAENARLKDQIKRLEVLKDIGEKFAKSFSESSKPK